MPSHELRKGSHCKAPRVSTSARLWTKITSPPAKSNEYIALYVCVCMCMCVRDLQGDETKGCHEDLPLCLPAATACYYSFI